MTTTVEPGLLKRLNGELRILKRNPPQHIDAFLDDKTMMLWYFLIKGPEFSDFAGGYYIGKIILNQGYPYTPPDFMMLTPNGRFQVGKKICLSNTGFHSDQWSPSWTICANLIGILSIMLDDNDDGIAHDHKSKAEREALAKNSIKYNVDNYRDIFINFRRFIDENGVPVTDVSTTNVSTTNVSTTNVSTTNVSTTNVSTTNVSTTNKPISEPIIESNEPVSDMCMVPKRGRRSKKLLIETLDLDGVDKINTNKTEKKYKKLIKQI
ncbi:MAG: ubiquitin-conjugating enzyme E2 [Homavirus sp.]|uniref:E2 ubiquitin-conjugating enzyme n=1 Tax=Homavirus sp. TaxID=2487769 RepID=A0A3G5AAJ0_9VIRU|nr:MAG: ubiquitin-conjugating enzyme E2 [Homavirus sp.]